MKNFCCCLTSAFKIYWKDSLHSGACNMTNAIQNWLTNASMDKENAERWKTIFAKLACYKAEILSLQCVTLWHVKSIAKQYFLLHIKDLSRHFTVCCKSFPNTRKQKDKYALQVICVTTSITNIHSIFRAQSIPPTQNIDRPTVLGVSLTWWYRREKI